MSDFSTPEPDLSESEKSSYWRIGWPEAVVIVIICFVAYSILSMVLATSLLRPHGGASRTSLVSNLKQIGTSAMMYSVDYDERLPFIEPFEFGEDFLDPYIKNKEIHENRTMARSGKKRKPGTTQHEFRFAYAPLTLDGDTWIRKIVDIRSTPKLETIPIVWSEVEYKVPSVGILFADGHVKAPLLESVRPAYSPGFFGADTLPAGRLNYVVKGADWPPPTWFLPAADVEKYIRQVKR